MKRSIKPAARVIDLVDDRAYIYPREVAPAVIHYANLFPNRLHKTRPSIAGLYSKQKSSACASFRLRKKSRMPELR